MLHDRLQKLECHALSALDKFRGFRRERGRNIGKDFDRATDAISKEEARCADQKNHNR